jgi:hypothetical protein
VNEFEAMTGSDGRELSQALRSVGQVLRKILAHSDNHRYTGGPRQPPEDGGIRMWAKQQGGIAPIELLLPLGG